MARLVVVDGPDGGGKTTVMDGLMREFPGLVRTREPGGTPLAEKIRKVILDPLSSDQDPITMLCLFFAARRAHLKGLVEPALAEGRSVLTDRFDTSTYAYQVYGCDDLRVLELFRDLRHMVLGDIDPFYIFLDVDTDVALARLAARDDESNHFDEDGYDKHARRRKGYRHFVEEFALPPDQYRFVDANRTLEEVLADVIKIVRPLLA